MTRTTYWGGNVGIRNDFAIKKKEKKKLLVDPPLCNLNIGTYYKLVGL